MTLVVVANHIEIIQANNQFFGSQTDLTEDDFRIVFIRVFVAKTHRI